VTEGPGEAAERPDVPEFRQDFAAGLQQLRRRAGLSYRELQRRTGVPVSTLNDAVSGRVLPRWDTVEAIVRACAADVEQWRERWLRIDNEQPVEQPSAVVMEPPSGRTRPASTRLVVALGALLVVTLVAGLAGYLTSRRHTPPACERVWQYRASAAGELYDAGGSTIGNVLPGDLVNVRRRDGLRFYGAVARSGKWGYVESGILDYVAPKCVATSAR